MLDERRKLDDADPVDMALNAKILQAVGFLGSHPLAEQVFRVVTNQIGATGWQIARELQQPPKTVELTLSDLVKHEVVKADGQGLNAYYIPSGQAYIVRERMAS